MLSVQRDRHIL